MIVRPFWFIYFCLLDRYNGKKKSIHYCIRVFPRSFSPLKPYTLDRWREQRAWECGANTTRGEILR